MNQCDTVNRNSNISINKFTREYKHKHYAYIMAIKRKLRAQKKRTLGWRGSGKKPGGKGKVNGEQKRCKLNDGKHHAKELWNVTY